MIKISLQSKRFLIIILSIQIIFLITQNFNLPIFAIKTVITFINITIVPGIVLLKSLKIRRLSYIDTILYSVGFSLSMLMFVGFFTNTVYPFMGIDKPISVKYLSITLSLLISILCIIVVIRNKTEEEGLIKYSRTPLNTPMVFIVILLLVILCLSVFGTYLANFFHKNFILMSMLILIAISVILITIMDEKKIIYPLVIYMMALSLLYHNSLISSYLTGWDIQQEYYLSNIVITNQVWDSNIMANINAMLSIVILVPTFSFLYSVDPIWIYKILFPLIFALVPIGLFRIFQKQTDDKIAFLSCFFFISIFTFYVEMVSLARQQIAELFLVVIIMIMMDDNINRQNKIIMYMIFGFSLGVSHYGISYIFLFSLIVIYFSFAKNIDIIFTRRYILIFFIFVLTWYVYVGEGSAIITITKIGSHIKDSISEMLNPRSVEGMNVIVRSELSPMRQITKYLHLLTQFFIMLGVYITIKYNRVNYLKLNVQKKYMNFSYTSVIILVLGIGLPSFASSINTTRLYQISLLFLAQFSIIGMLAILFLFKINIKKSLIIVSIFFSIFLLFNSGFIYEIKKEPSSSMSLNYTSDGPRFSETEIITAKWIKEKIYKNENLFNLDMDSDIDSNLNNNIDSNLNNETKIYSDIYKDLLLSSMIGKKNPLIGNDDIITKISPNNYIFLGKENTQNGRITLMSTTYKSRNINLKNTRYYKKFSNMNKIYDSSYTQILLTR